MMAEQQPGALRSKNQFLSNTPLKKGGGTLCFLPRQEGQGLLEYAFILILVAIVVIAIVLILGPATGSLFSNVVANV